MSQATQSAAEVYDLAAARRGPGDRDAAFALFYAHFHPRLLGYAARAWGERDAEEITQEAFARAYESLDLTRSWRNQWGWLVVVGRNIAGDLARSRRLCEVPDGAEPAYAEPTVPDHGVTEQFVLDKECLSQFRRALVGLPASQSRAWWLTIAEGMTPTTIADSLGCSPESVRQALFKSRKRLTEAMAAYCGRVRALAVPVLLLVRRCVRSSAQHAARPAANAALAATMTSATLLGAIAILEQTGGPTVHTPLAAADNVTSAADRVASSGAASAASTRTGQLSVTGRAGTTVRTPAAASPLHTTAWISKTPFAPGEKAEIDVIVSTPIGDVGVKQKLVQGPGEGYVCRDVTDVPCAGPSGR